MAMIKPLPQLQIRLPIVTMTGEPTTTFHRYFNTEFGGAIYRNQVQLEEAVLNIQAALDAAAAAQAAAAAAQTAAETAQTTAETAQTTATTAQTTATTAQTIAATAQTTADDAFTIADGITDGTTTITALNVAGTDVAPFLGKTDGSKLVMASGLDDGVVETPSIAVEAVTKSQSGVVAGPINIKSTTAVSLSSESVTIEDGERVELLLVFTISGAGNGTIGELAALSSARLSRGGTTLIESVVGAVIKEVPIAQTATMAFSDTPSAGTYTYTAHSFVNTTSNVNALEASNIYLSAMVVKR